MTVNLSAIIPVTKMHRRLAHLEKMFRDPEANLIEFIVVHDIADELTGEDLIPLCNSFSNVRLLQGKYGSPGRARNAGIEIATGEWIAFWDSDDDPSIGAFILMANNTDKFGFNVGIGDYHAINDLNLFEYYSSPRKKISNLYINVGLWRMCFRRDRIKDIKFKSFRMAEDQVFFAELDLSESEIFFLEEPVYTYFFGSSHHLTQDPKAILDLREASIFIESIISDEKINRNLLSMFLRQRISLIKRIKFSQRLLETYLTLMSIFRLQPKPKETLYALKLASRKTLKR